MKELWSWGAVEIAAAVRSKEISAREATAASLARIDDANPKINAVVDVLRDEALAAADAADRAVRRGDDLGILHGVPVTTKINTDQKGCATNNGLPAFKDHVASEDAPAVANWRRAGAIMIGRTNAPEFSVRWFTDNPVHGTTFNPWSRDITPGGSSGGAASAIAAGIGALAHGNDSAGSIRYPAYACGIAGIRPSVGRVPSFDPSSSQDRSISAQIVSVQGLLGRQIRDLRLGLAAMSVRDVRDPWWVPAPLEAEQPNRPYRIAVIADIPQVMINSDVKETVIETAKWLEDAGCSVEFAAPPCLGEACDLWLAIVMMNNRLNTTPTVEKLGTAKVRHAVAGMLRASPVLDLRGFMSALMRRDTILREWQCFFERYDVVLMPTSFDMPYPFDHDQRDDRAMDEIMAGQKAMLCASILGLPALSVPVRLVDGVPAGVQIISGRFQEETCFRVGEIVEARSQVKTPIDVQWS